MPSETDSRNTVVKVQEQQSCNQDDDMYVCNCKCQRQVKELKREVSEARQEVVEMKKAAGRG